MKPIRPQNVRIMRGSETELYEDCGPGDTVVKVKDASGWEKKLHNGQSIDYIAFDVGPGYADLPNFKLSSMGFERIREMNDYWEIELETPVEAEYDEDTKVRQHHSGGSYMYEAACATMDTVPSSWTKYASTTKGMKDYEVSSCKVGEWRPGSKYARIIMLLNYDDPDGGGDSAGQTVLVDDISLKVV